MQSLPSLVVLLISIPMAFRLGHRSRPGRFFGAVQTYDHRDSFRPCDFRSVELLCTGCGDGISPR